MLAALLLVLSAAAAAAPDAGGLTFDEALGLAEHVPSVEAGRTAVGAQRDVAGSISSQTANPELRLEPGYRLSSSSGSTTRFEGTVGIAQSWSLAGLGARRREAALGEGDQLEAEVRAAALARRLSAAQAWIDLWAAQATLVEARHELALAADLADRTERAAAHALITRAEAADAITYRAEARLLAISADGEVTDVGYRLARETARPPTALLATGELPLP